MDAAGLAALGAVIVSAGSVLVTYIRGRQGDKALGIANNASAQATQTQTAFQAYSNITDQLQEDIAGYRAEIAALRERLASREVELEGTRQQLRDMKHEMGGAKAQLSAAKVVIEGLERQLDVQTKELQSMRLVMRNHEATIAEHERTINALRHRLGGAP